MSINLFLLCNFIIDIISFGTLVVPIHLPFKKILVVFDKYSPPLPSASVIAGAESEIEVELRRQLAAMESAVQTFTQQVETFNRALDQTQRSEEKRQLEDSVGNLLETLQQTRDEVTQSLSEEVDRWKKLYERLFPASPAKP